MRRVASTELILWKSQMRSIETGATDGFDGKRLTLRHPRACMLVFPAIPSFGLERSHVFENTPNKDFLKCPSLLAFAPHPRDEWSCQGAAMTEYPYILFNQTPEDLHY